MSLDSETYDKLSAPFEKTHQKQGLTYITGEQAISRINDVLGFDAWSFKVVMHGYKEEADELWVLGELTLANGQVVQQFGSQKHNRRREDKTIIDYGFDLKGAATDALKKCASLRGVGLYLHEKDGSPGATQQAPATARSGAASDQPVRPPAATPPARNATAPLKKPGLYEVAAQMGFSRDHVDAASQRFFDNRAAAALNKEEKQNLLRLMEEEKKKEAVPA